MTKPRPAVRKLCETLCRRTEYPGTTGNWIMESPSGYGIVITPYAGRVVFTHSVRRSTLDEAVELGFVALGDEDEVPEYEHGRGQWRWEPGRRGRPITYLGESW